MNAYSHALTVGLLLSSWAYAAEPAGSAGALEKAFWICDYAATTHGVHPTRIGWCSTVTEKLKKTRFGGDFEEMLEWWKLNKVAEHHKLATEGL